MSISSEITRITTDRNTIRTKLVTIGLATGTDTLDDLASAINNMANKGTPDAEVKEGESYTIAPGYYQGGTVRGVAGGGNYSLQPKSVTPTKQQQNVSPDAGYYGLSDVTVAPIPDNYQDVSSVTAEAAHVLATKMFVPADGTLTAGTMPNIGKVSVTLDTETPSYTVPAGYHNGEGSVSVASEEKTVTPTTSQQVVESDTDKYLTKVTVNAIPSQFVDSSAVDAAATNVLSGKKAVVKTGTDTYEVATGTMPNNGAISATLDTTTTSKTIPAGYTSGGSVSIVTEEKTATPTKSTQNITPTSGKVLQKVVVNPIPDNYVNLNNFSPTDALAEHIRDGKSVYLFDPDEDGFTRIEGTMPVNGSQSGKLDTATTSKTIPAGYTDGGTVSVASESKTVTPSTSQQVVTGTSNKYLTQVTVNAIPAQYVDSSTVDAVAANVLSGKKAVVKTGTSTYAVVSGTMTNNGAVSGTIDGLTATSFTVPAGYTSGGSVSLTNDIETALAAI